MFQLRTLLVCGSLAAAAASCGTPSASSPGHRSEVPMPRRAVAMPVAVTAGGAVEVFADGKWSPLDPAAPRTNVTGIRAIERGAVLAFGDPAHPRARLWLRGKTTVAVGENDAGALHVAVEAGRARLMVIDIELAAFARASDRFVEARDVVIEGTGDAAVAIETDRRPQAAAWTMAIEAPPEASGIGRLETARPGQDPVPLELRRVRVNVVTHGAFAMTEIEHVFFNASAQRLEGTFRFPVPDGAMVRGLAMEINGKLMEGEIVEKEKARRTYESIVDQMLDPALLEWEHGNWFKLRVFPIEPASEKRVVLRYAAPLARGLDGWEYSYAVSAPARSHRVGKLVVTFNGKTVEDTTELSAGKEIVIPVADRDVPAVARETVDGATYTAVRIRPDWEKVVSPARSKTHRKLFIIVDTSRSSLEARELALETLGLVLGELEHGDTFQVAASDLTARARGDRFVAPSDEAVAGAIDFIRAIEPDGASNLAAALELAGKSGATEVVYIGDGTPTWGVTEPAALTALTERALAQRPLHAAILGKGASAELWADLTGRAGGRAARPRTSVEARQFAFFVGRADTTARIEAAQVAEVDGSQRFPLQATTLFSGDELVAVIRTDKGKPLPAAVTLRGRAAGKPFEQKVEIASAATTRLVAQQWATAQIAALEIADGDHGAEIVELSQKFGVLSKKTSLLVLESEEAYREHQIERRQQELQAQALAANDAAPQVTGGDLESLSGEQASLSPDEIQPGDPEITIPAPADARSVVVVFPFGDTKLAEYDAEREAWMVRFLIDKDTPDGRYLVTVKVTHADGRIETLELPYYVDTRAPTMTLSVVPRGAGYFITARQKSSARDVVKNDAHRVEVVLPGGEVFELSQVTWNRFEGLWTPAAPLTETLRLDVVITDRALNQAEQTLTVEAGQ